MLHPDISPHRPAPIARVAAQATTRHVRPSHVRTAVRGAALSLVVLAIAGCLVLLAVAMQGGSP